MTEPRSVLITGASRGIGRACALGLAARGWRVFAGVRNVADGSALRDEAGERLRPIRLDITDADQIAEAAALIAEGVGDRGLDGLVNNAGIAVAGPLEFVPLTDFRAQLETNVVGTLAVTQAMLGSLRRAKGRLVMISSLSGRVGFPLIGPYCASKAAMEAMADSLRVELHAHGVSVSVVQPGPIETKLVEDSIRQAERRIEALPPLVMETYGPLMEASLASARGTMSDALPTEAVVRQVAHALESRRPKTRYLTVRGGWAYRMATNLTPDRWRDAVVRRVLAHYQARPSG
jgi:NAD(P)-dependent dehydrogenase (short-subunit alcohol dehydrogenase family)